MSSEEERILANVAIVQLAKAGRRRKRRRDLH
jgi:hypothetical protein